MKPPMDANERELILKEEVYAVVVGAIEVLNVRGVDFTRRFMRTAFAWSAGCEASLISSRNVTV
jgi:hypothetical protein